MSDRSRIRDAFLEEFGALLDAVEVELKLTGERTLPQALEVLGRQHEGIGRLEIIQAGYMIGVLDALQRLDVAEELIDRVLERAGLAAN